MSKKLDTMKGMTRTHNLGALTKEDVGKEVVLMGWVASRRDHGGVIFVDLRDRWGVTQVVFNPEVNAEIHAKAEGIRSEYVLALRGEVSLRHEGMANPNLATGEIEVAVSELRVLNVSAPPPFPIERGGSEVNEEIRLKFRYLDLRRPEMQQNLLLRAKAYQAVRNHLTTQEFIEVETPVLMKSTPEGARDFLVPSRLQQGSFYALPQSPQTYKQLLMVGGYDRYFQIVKCFRDEDLRSDRQPEFTQIDIEMSFVDEEAIMSMAENLMRAVYSQTIGVEFSNPIDRMTYEEATNRYGVDKPDRRFELQLVDLSDICKEVDFRVFSQTLESGGVVKAINLVGGGDISRTAIENQLTPFVKTYKAKGLAWMKATEDGFQSSIVKFFSDEAQNRIREKTGAKPGDLLLFLADQTEIVHAGLGALRLKLAKERGLLDESKWDALWVTDFPLLDWSPEDKRWMAMHHPFTSPREEDVEKMTGDNPGEIIARAYDLVINGAEIAGGSVRIFQSELQSQMFDLLGIGQEEAQEKFGFLLEALTYGAPPHGGIAFGFDRMVAQLAGVESIRDVIAFPKTNQGQSLMDGSPSEVSDEQLQELSLRSTVQKDN